MGSHPHMRRLRTKGKNTIRVFRAILNCSPSIRTHANEFFFLVIHPLICFTYKFLYRVEKILLIVLFLLEITERRQVDSLMMFHLSFNYSIQMTMNSFYKKNLRIKLTYRIKMFIRHHNLDLFNKKNKISINKYFVNIYIYNIIQKKKR
jgi:hypothetical protein